MTTSHGQRLSQTFLRPLLVALIAQLAVAHAFSFMLADGTSTEGQRDGAVRWPLSRGVTQAAVAELAELTELAELEDLADPASPPPAREGYQSASTSASSGAYSGASRYGADGVGPLTATPPTKPTLTVLHADVSCQGAGYAINYASLLEVHHLSTTSTQAQNTEACRSLCIEKGPDCKAFNYMCYVIWKAAS
ncbi:hypothetical protein TSOC_004021 [Tetrabaena socialis]|uniref:Apple domain-containing protein n=1 Tax=Tetrabaena socialis TaxID=47790 RepID=A0A2J8AA13_9CHLO|nr:hypothetical protein TSOC_004021 [Tetrabaena socialis]|eukprot:PNH09364.1 hypothetical protein TSOC_004021 [Tetrabaena socialis]